MLAGHPMAARVSLAALAASWGLIAVLVGWVDLGAPALAFLRLALGTLTLALLALALRISLDPRGHLARLGVLGVLQGAHWLLFFETVKLGSVALAVLTFYTAPVLLALCAPAVLGERVSKVAVAALPVGLAGVALVALGGDTSDGFSWTALGSGLGSAATFAALVLVSKRLLAGGVPAATIAFWDCLVGAVTVLPVILFVGRLLPRGAGEWAAVLALGVAFTGLSTLIYTALLRRVTAQTAGILTFLEPVAAVGLAALILDEPLDAATLAGGLLVLGAGVAVVALDPG